MFYVSILNVCWRRVVFRFCNQILPRGRYYRMLQNCRNGRSLCVTLAPHCPLGPIALAACLHTTLFPITPYFRNKVWAFITTRRGVTRLCEKQRRLQHGRRFFKPLTKPGLGVEIDEAKVIGSVKMPRTGVIRSGVMKITASRVVIPAT